MIKNRVPHIILLYWIIKIASTTLGETGADMFSMSLELGYGATTGIFLLLFLLLLGVKLSMRRYDPFVYWSLFTASAVAGTGISDYIDRTLGVGYLLGSLYLLILLLLTLAVWYKKEGSLSVERVTTAPAELFYWSAFLIANTLGTAAGDYLADTLEVGFLTSAVLIGATLALLALLHFRSKVSTVLLFWIAFVLTRPFGATFGDLLTKPVQEGGIGLGPVAASLFFALILIVAVTKEMAVEKSDKTN